MEIAAKKTHFHLLAPFSFFQVYKHQCILISHNQDVRHLLSVLKSHINYQASILSCISGVDMLGCKQRFSIVYELLSLPLNLRLRIKIFTNEISPVFSSTSVYKNASWWEREIWDLFGIVFVLHFDLRRILTDYGFEGHPLRKDFPVSGLVEFRFDEKSKRIVSNLLSLSQESKGFHFYPNW